MLFYLKYIEHDVEKLQKLLVYFFDKVEEVNPTIFDRTTLLPDWYSIAANRMKGLESKLSEFIAFDNSVKTRIIQAFREANEIELLFSDKNRNAPTKFGFDKDLWKQEKKKDKKGEYIKDKKGEYIYVSIMVSTFLQELFADFLYETQLGNKTGTFSKIIETSLSKHYEEFKKEANYRHSRYLVCPFCGLELMKDEKNIGRPDYDHLLPKSKFVFSSVNMKNLIAAGDDCNGLKDTHSLLHTDQALQNRTLAFYPYSKPPHPFEQFFFKLNCIHTPVPNDINDEGKWQVEIIANDPSDTDLLEKIETWNRVYKIKDRYAQFICNHHQILIRKEFNLKKNEKPKPITSIKSIEELIEILKAQLGRLPYSYYSLITEINVIPKRIFYQWALDNEDYLQRFIDANNLESEITDQYYSDLV